MNNKVVKIQIGVGENAKTIELQNNDETIAEMRASYDDIIERLEATIADLRSKINELEEKMNRIDDEPSGGETGSSQGNGSSL